MMSGVCILVTGGAGFIGSHLVDQLLAEEGRCERLVVLDSLTYAGCRSNLERAEADPRCHFVEGDVRDAALVRDLLGRHRIDRIAHLAAETHVDRSIDGPAVFVSTNVLGTAVLLEEFRRHLAGHRGDARPVFVQASTDEVFGSLGPEDPPFSETSRQDPTSPYSASKAGADQLVKAYGRTYGLPVVVSHVSNTYGPRQFPEKLVPLMILKALKGEELPVYGDGGQIRDWLHVDDHCRGLRRALESGSPGESYLFGSGTGTTNLDLVRTIAAILKELAPDVADAGERIGFVADRPAHDRRYAVNASKARRELDWLPEVDLLDGLRETVAWYLENQPWWAAIERKNYRGERLGVGADPHFRGDSHPVGNT